MKNKEFSKKVDWYLELREFSKVQVKHRPELLPSSIDEAYAIQKAVIDSLGANVSGWKLGGTNQKTKETFLCQQLYFGPVFENKAFNYSDIIDLNGLIELKGEAELVFKLSKKVEALSEHSLDDIASLITHVAPGVELPSACFSDMKIGGVNLLIADLCGTGALVTGNFSEFVNFDELENININLEYSSELNVLGNTNNILPDQLSVFSEFMTLALKYGIPLREGQLVATGGCTSCEKFKHGTPVNADFGSLGHFSFVPQINR